MIEPHSISERARSIRDLIANDEIGDAMKNIMDFVRDFSTNDDYLDEITVVSADYRTLETEYRRKLISVTKFTSARGKVILKALQLVNAVRREYGDTPVSTLRSERPEARA